MIAIKDEQGMLYISYSLDIFALGFGNSSRKKTNASFIKKGKSFNHENYKEC